MSTLWKFHISHNNCLLLKAKLLYLRIVYIPYFRGTFGIARFTKKTMCAGSGVAKEMNGVNIEVCNQWRSQLSQLGQRR